jgi:hypothetical protein
MCRYAELSDCRRRFLLQYFGEALLEPCGRCDNCDAGRSTVTDHGDQALPAGRDRSAGKSRFNNAYPADYAYGPGEIISCSNSDPPSSTELALLRVRPQPLISTYPIASSAFRILLELKLWNLRHRMTLQYLDRIHCVFLCTIRGLPFVAHRFDNEHGVSTVPR